MFIKAFERFDSANVEWTTNVDAAASLTELEWQRKGAMKFILAERLCLVSYSAEPQKTGAQPSQHEQQQPLFVVRDRDGDYLSAVISTDWETVPLEFRWTKDIALAKQFCGDELNSKTDAVSLMQRIIHGHAGAQQIRVR